MLCFHDLDNLNKQSQFLIQSERNFLNARKIVTKARTNLADDIIDMFCFLKLYFVN